MYRRSCGFTVAWTTAVRAFPAVVDAHVLSRSDKLDWYLAHAVEKALDLFLNAVTHTLFIADVAYAVLDGSL